MTPPPALLVSTCWFSSWFFLKWLGGLHVSVIYYVAYKSHSAYHQDLILETGVLTLTRFVNLT